MPEIHKKNIKRAAQNVISFGDTDVFPYSFENVLIRRNTDGFVELIERLSNSFDEYIKSNPPQFENILSPVGYNGYRWITQIDPYWNAFMLSGLLRHAVELENARTPTTERSVHSYRLSADQTTDDLFEKEWNWRSFMQESYARASQHAYVVTTDISEFYRRIYHHRVENSLERVCKTNIPDKIIELLSAFSLGTSYGLPIGGPASRIMAEIVINQVDHLLNARGINFCRFVDDFHIFANSEEDAYRCLQQLTELLIINQGLNLQKSKTRVMTGAEFIGTFPSHLVPGATAQSDRERLFTIDLNYDPYSPTAETDYETLKQSLSGIDFLSLLDEELHKSQVHTPTVSKLIRALRAVDGTVREQAIKTLVGNVPLLYPVFSQLLIMLNSMRDDLTENETKIVCDAILKMVSDKSYLMALDVHRAYAVRLLYRLPDYRVDSVFTDWLANGCSALKRDVIIGFAARGGWDHLSDFKNRTAGQTAWVKRAMIAASYGLGDEGKHWRNDNILNDFDRFVRDTSSNFDASSYGDLI
ncbi:RNA-directed DNA polymerase [Sphingorhabdus lacus]|uniref:RNA-directed DNA polymerase n=1 Tax=Sphingorhabdus lacus TaxID=392610 RepID=A0A6I6L5G4_9SPHN|nr:RNA-directed DNA polymerase [Sphingorhabdus lacus]QGY79186.1 RNA-directed DNA polymerase [Sphingorhabdus lacus]